MKAQLIGRYIEPNKSVSLQNYSSENFLKIWHYHPELELDVILSSTGTRFVGDSIKKFIPGDVVLMGENLPHLWLNDNIYFQEHSALKAEAVVIHFDNKLVSGMQQIPEMENIISLIQKAKVGVAFRGGANSSIIKKATDMVESSAYDRVNILINIMAELAARNDFELLSSSGFVNSFQGIPKSRMAPVYNYVMNNFKEEIKLETIAKIAHMNPSSFSRYFSNYHKKTFTQFVNEIRIGFACKMLMEYKCNISQVCYESGFNNISNFNRVFKAIKQISPSEYIKLHLNKRL
ncbi:AraC family transcriptional regulator [Arenibacter sp. ARW7G5Y1]|uniref:AraC family transcriptional regulator n=1 Tax=Arenibacter sp. ARW7G5Y1 TaxID=2135619 RepID=UPI000D770F58|nr:AraC family transcriptional regulator [Arenibacter sp. ARW7G5Y1]PXX23993.1 AraC family transcriptional regulator [Arenibacter sp. ARW7G5Y1]|tara:strand:+ start:28652 stop:29524 length:873 start_codon:yes stop_codon:yes gene_type:complete